MRIVFFGDSITAGAKREDYGKDYTYGNGFLGFVAGELLSRDPYGYEIFNSGIGGNRIVDMYARIKKDVWNLAPDVVNILGGINDVWFEVVHKNGVDIERYEKIYRAIIEDTMKAVPGVKIILCEPFVLRVAENEEKYDELLAVKEYARVVKRLAEEYSLPFFPFQDLFDRKAEEYEPKCWLWDGVHPTRGGAKLMADRWLEMFRSEIEGK